MDENEYRKFVASGYKQNAAEEMYDALWAAVELSDRTLTKSGRTAECQKVYDQCVNALKLAEGE